MDTPGGYVLFTFGVLLGEGDAHRELFRAIANTIRFVGPNPKAGDPGEILWAVFGTQGVSQNGAVALGQIFGLAVNPSEEIVYIAESVGILVLNANDGSAIDLLPLPKSQGQVAQPSGIAVAADGTLWLSDNGNQRLYHLSAMGELLQVVGSYAASGETVEIGMFDDYGPEQILITADGRLVVFNRGHNAPHRILTFDAEGLFVSEFTLPKGEHLRDYDRCSIGPDEQLYCSVSVVGSTAEIAVFTLDGTLLQTIILDDSPAPRQYGTFGAMVIRSDGTLWASDANVGVVYHFDTDGTVIETFGKEQSPLANPTQPNNPGEFGFDADYDLRGLAVLRDGNLVIGDSTPYFSQVIRVGFGTPGSVVKRGWLRAVL